jgi:hypothetical protein
VEIWHKFPAALKVFLDALQGTGLSEQALVLIAALGAGFFFFTFLFADFLSVLLRLRHTSRPSDASRHLRFVVLRVVSLVSVADILTAAFFIGLEAVPLHVFACLILFFIVFLGFLLIKAGRSIAGRITNRRRKSDSS